MAAERADKQVICIKVLTTMITTCKKKKNQLKKPEKQEQAADARQSDLCNRKEVRRVSTQGTNT